MAVKKATRKRSSAEIKRLVDAITADIQKQKSLRKSGEMFTALSRDEIVRKLERKNSPFISWQGWSTYAAIGGPIYYQVCVVNPDPTVWNNLAVSVAVGNRNSIVSNDSFLSEFDPRFPTLAQEPGGGFSLGAAGSATASKVLNFTLKIPAGVEKTGYFGNTALFQLNFHDVGLYLDRGVFFFGVI